MKKAQVSSQVIAWTIMVIIITGLLFGLFLVINTYTNKQAEISPRLQSEIIALRFANIPECFAFEDKNTGRVYPGLINLEKFNNEQLSKCYHTKEIGGFWTYNFELKLQQSEVKINTDKYVGSNNPAFTLFKEVAVKDGEEIIKDTLAIYVQESAIR
jgi:hypothetical protein